MVLRRAFFYLQFAAVPVLPLWVLIGRGLVLNDPGREFVLLILLCPILALAMLVVAGIMFARKAVRRSRELSWLDVAVLSAWYVSIIAAGLVAHPAMVILVVVLCVVAFWVALWQLFTETRRRVNTVIARLTAIPGDEYLVGSRPDPRIIRIDQGR